jgi:hypothetical protein
VDVAAKDKSCATFDANFKVRPAPPLPPLPSAAAAATLVRGAVADGRLRDV